ncbi:HpcH/HpaI aldolase/citrate lyase family protein [Phyllobacterium zundukense]|uniref:CoA ester lyase n=1 Tax=Phyllobacterium zundukense TaxID=1867719 RepID=A0A2N9W1R3_9HYPH|nr:CoA ester lyase [Phyllobacterium zundukense]ATU91546.1 CoA ester lyase [Phyllobacterium zundukense]PIO45681.1 CoA ester lyase [Phyllobacterium zundukense]
MRSLLFVPGDSEKKLEKGLTSGADVLLIDLEDSVSAERKETARRIAADFLTANRDRLSPRLFVRINDLTSGLANDDLTAVMPALPHGILLPKSNSGKDVTRLAAKLNVHEARAGVAEGSTQILAIITETAIGTLSAASYPDVSTRLIGLSWGAEDLSAAIGARKARDESGRYTDVFRLARAVTILGASAAEVAAIDTVYINYRDDGGLARECMDAERDGFTGKLAIHPAQVPIINETFTPSAEAVEHARKIIDAFSADPSAGVIGIDGQMFDRPHLRRAERLVARTKSTT